ncbi:MAG: helix-turn-helix domain-containing protein [Phycisphaerales bacterium JB037]
MSQPLNDTTNAASKPIAMRPKEAAKALGICERLLWERTNRGEIPHVRIGRAVVYPVAELERWLAEQSSRSTRGGRGGGR